MTTNSLRRIVGLAVMMLVVLTLAQLGAVAATAPNGTGPIQRAASIRWTPIPRRTTTTVPRTTTTKAPTTTTTKAPAVTTTTKAPAPTTTTTKAPAPTTTTTKAPTPTTAPAPIGSLSSAAQADMLATVNATRATGATCGGKAYPAVPPLTLQSNLAASADGHARDMATQNYFSHTGLNGSTPATRITAAGYRWSAWAENIAAGQTTSAAAMSGWFASAGHCANFMSAGVTQIGFGRAENPSSSYRIYWVADLGRPA